MSTVKSKNLQVGTDATATNNFTIYQPSTPDGTLRIGVGNADSPTEVAQFTSSGFSSSGHILQVVQMVKTDTSSATSASTNTFVDLPGMSVAITPSSSSSKILVSFTVSLGFVTGTFHINLVRGSTNIAVGDADGSRIPSTISMRPNGTPYTHDSSPRSYTFLDSPNTTSATTYKLQGTLGSTYSGTMYVNRSAADTNADYGVRVTSTMTAMEVAG